MSELAWSLVLDGFGLIPITLMAYKLRATFIFQWILMGMWCVYAIDKGGYGFIPGALVYSVFYFFAWRKWAPPNSAPVAAHRVSDASAPCEIGPSSLVHPNPERGRH